jgi:hypothetical protein
MRITNMHNDKTDIIEMGKFIEMIKSYDIAESFFSYPFIRNAIKENSIEINLPVPKFVIPKFTKLFRGRVHKNGEQFFHKISDISYNRDIFLIKNFGRANEPCQSTFYCSDNPNTAFMETCTIAREDLDKDFEHITWGVWDVIDKIPISYVIGSPSEKTTNEMLNTLTKVFINFLNDFSEEDKKEFLIFHDFISKQFQIEAKGRHSLYKISCAYSNWIYDQKFQDYLSCNKKIKQIAGLMYRSSIWPKEGMNIALRNETVDTSLRLIEAHMDHIRRNGNFYDGSERITAKSIDMTNNAIIWT